MRRRLITTTAIALLMAVVVFSLQPADTPDRPDRPAPESVETENSIYFPYIRVTGLPPCTDHDRGVAWLAGPGPRDRDTYCFTWWYNSGGNDGTGRYADGQIPILWCDRDFIGQDVFAVAERLGKSGYSGYVLVLNEPDQITQCNRSPRRAAEITAEFARLVPGAMLVGPNIIIDGPGKILWLDHYLDYLSAHGVELERIGVHFYGGVAPIEERIEWICEYLVNRDGSCRFWVTEFGVGHSPIPAGREADFYRGWIEAIEGDGRIERYFGYTVRDSWPAGRHDWERGRGYTEWGWEWVYSFRTP